MKTCAVFLVEDFEPVEAITVIDILTRGGVDVSVLSLTGEIIVNGSNHVTVLCDKVFSKNYLSDESIEYKYDFNYDCVVLPGGKGTPNYSEDKEFLAGLKKFHDDGKFVCAICAAPTVLDEIGILDDKTAVCYPTCEDKLKNARVSDRDVEVDGNVITSRSVGTALEFSLAILKVLMGHEVAENVRESLAIN